jgi:hypothetical protein
MENRINRYSKTNGSLIDELPWLKYTFPVMKSKRPVFSAPKTQKTRFSGYIRTRVNYVRLTRLDMENRIKRDSKTVGRLVHEH